MADACRKKISDWWGSKRAGENAGLLHDRFLQVAVGDEEKMHRKAREDLFDAMRQSLVQSKEIYKAAYKRQVASFKNLQSKGLFSTTGRLVIGLGGENVLETGLTLNHIYGTPMIPGTALKGLAAHYCNRALGAADGRFKLGGEYHQIIFGTTEDAGHFIFHDAWITPESLERSLQPDVITPHHVCYYSDETGQTSPTDFDVPKPFHFLTVLGTFHVAISCDVPGLDGEEWADRVFEMLADALKEWGIGGKTNAGYGRLVRADLHKEDISEKKRDLPTEKIDSSSTKKKVPTPPQSVTRMPRYIRGDILEVTRIADPKEKRGKPYFIADDGIGGPVTSGTPPSIEIGQKTRLKVGGVMKEGYYVFVALAPEGQGHRQKKVGRGK